MWHEWLRLECVCEFAAFARIHLVQIEEALDRVTVTGRDLDGLILPWARRPDHARRAHAVRVLADYHDRKRPKRRGCEACGASYDVPIRRGNVPRKCEACG